MCSWLRWLLMALALLPNTVSAVQSSTLGIYPSDALASPTPWFQYHLQPRQSTEGSVTIDNRSSAAQDLTLYAVDAAPNGDGGFGMEPQSKIPADAGSWIKLAVHSVHLLPDTQQIVPFTFTIPAHTSVGPHYAGIIAQPTTPTQSSASGINLRIISRLGVRVYEIVPGRAHPQLTITALKPHGDNDHVVLTATLRNGGNTLLTPSGHLQLVSLPGKATVQSFNAGRALQPSDQLTIHLPTTASSYGFPRRYTAQLSLCYGVSPHYQTVMRTVTFWTGDIWAWLAGLILLVLAAVVGAVKYCTHHHRNRNHSDQDKP